MLDFELNTSLPHILKNRIEEQLHEANLTMSIVVAVVVAVVTIMVVLFFGIWKFKTKVLPSQSEAPRKYRFRKREKLMFYGRKMLRKVRSFTRNTMGVTGLRRKGSQKQMMNRIKRFLQRRRDSDYPQLKRKEPPPSFLEADWSDLEEGDHRLPPEVLYLLKSVRVFGNLEKPFFLELCRFMEQVSVKSGDFLFRVGQNDDSIYVVQKGKVEVFIEDPPGQQQLIKAVCTGDSIHSLLSILDVISGFQARFKTVNARAVMDSTILKLPAQAFKAMFDRFPESTVRVVQIIMVRLQRVTFLALHNYLGLTTELIKSDQDKPLVPGSPHKAARPLSASSASRDSPETASTSGTGDGLKGQDKAAGRKAEDEDSDFEAAKLTARVTGEGVRSAVPAFNRQVTAPEKHSDEGSPRPSSSRSQKSRRWSADIVLPDNTANFTDEVILESAKKDMAKVLGLTNESLLDGKVTLRQVKAGTYLNKEGDQDMDLSFVVTGCLSVLQHVVGEQDREKVLFLAQPGELVGMLGVLTGEPSFFSARAKVDTRLALVRKEDFYSIMKEEPQIILNAARSIVNRLTPFVRQIDFALDWEFIESGRALFRQGDDSDSVYVVLTGRLRSVITLVGGKKELVAEYGRGELVGIVEVLTHTERATTVMAVRDTEVAKMPSELLNVIKLRYPQVVTRLIHLLGQRILGNLQNRNTIALAPSLPVGDKVEISMPNLATVAVVAISPDVPLTAFSLELQHALSAIGSTTRLTSDKVKNVLGPNTLDNVNEYRLYNWLGQQEDIYRMVLYQCDYTVTRWTKICIRQADCIIIVGLYDNDPKVGEVEKDLDSLAVRAQRELVMLHRDGASTPSHTADWLNARSWCHSHHHLVCPKRLFSKQSPQKLMEMYEKLWQSPPDRMSDFSRLARFLTGTSIGLVLGGGGARGLAHVGMIKALQEAGIPIDMVAGTSMGAFIGALWAEERDFNNFKRRAREWSMGMTSLWKKIFDLTYPTVSMFSGREFNHHIEKVFPTRQIEDLWIPYFCVTTDITNSSMRIHTNGCLWRYVRASMTLSGYLPPMCDPVDGHLLMDGGYVNNLPADVMKTMGAQTVIAVDVGSVDETNLFNYGDELSGWWLLWKRWCPWSTPVKVPDMQDIQSRLAYVSCTRQLEVVKDADYCEYVRPPVDKYASLAFGLFDEVYEVGLQHGRTLLSGWTKGGFVNDLFKERRLQASPPHKRQAQGNVPVMAYFTDLAERASKMEKSKPHFYIDSDLESDYALGDLDEGEFFDEDEMEGNYLEGINEEGTEEEEEEGDDDDDEVYDVEEDDGIAPDTRGAYPSTAASHSDAPPPPATRITRVGRGITKARHRKGASLQKK